MWPFRKKYKYSDDRCRPDIYANGTAIGVVADIKDIDKFVSRLRKLSGQPVDWSSYCGRYAIMAIGDIDKVKAAFEVTKPQNSISY